MTWLRPDQLSRGSGLHNFMSIQEESLLDFTLSQALDRAVGNWPDKTFLRMENRDVTFAAFSEDVRGLATVLQALGVEHGDRLCVFMTNSVLCVETWFAANYLGAIWAPINTDFRGVGLRAVIELADPRICVCDAELLPFLREATPVGSSARVLTGEMLLQMRLESSGAPPHKAEGGGPTHLEFSEPSALLFTSGTTGRSKAALLPHRYFISQAGIAIRDFGLRHDDVLYCPFPLFHADATALTTVPALLLGCTAAIGLRFSASRFWNEVRSVGATVFDFMGATLSILNKAQPLPDDADNPVRLAWGVPVPEWAPQFEERFGLQILEVYGSVEVSIPVTVRYDQQRVRGSCGRVTPEFRVVIGDAFDQEVPRGAVGEILVRPEIPFTTMSCYYGTPEATVDAGRNFWFHTGDFATMDDDGNVYFKGRRQETIRRRGENISAFEVEEGLLQHPEIVECAVVGVPSDLSEEDVKACLVLRSGSKLNEVEVFEHCQRVLGRFQWPRYIEILRSLPKTPTGKIEKFRLHEPSVSESTWDRETLAR